jgi:hypothetical protein
MISQAMSDRERPAIEAASKHVTIDIQRTPLGLI